MRDYSVAAAAAAHKSKALPVSQYKHAIEALPVREWFQKRGPRADVKILPRDAKELRLSVGSLVNMSEAEVAQFAGLMNLYGAAVLAPKTDEGADAYKTLDRLLGRCVSHDCMDERGIVEINPAKPTSINVAQPETAHLPHTDDAYTEHPSRFITLQCRQAAPSGGGESVLVSLQIRTPRSHAAWYGVNGQASCCGWVLDEVQFYSNVLAQP